MESTLNNLISTASAQKYSLLEFQSEKEIRETQNRLLVEHIEYIANNSPYYKNKFKQINIDPKKIKEIGDLSALGFTEKKDIEQFNKEFQAAPNSEIADICLTSATTGNTASVFLQSFSDLSRLAYNEESAFKTCGITQNDTILISAAIDRCFMAGLAYCLGGLKLKSRIIRAGSVTPAQQWQMLKISNATVMVGVPSLIKKTGAYALSIGEDPSCAGVKKIIAIGESVRDEKLNILPYCEQIEKMWKAPLYSTYASTEMATAFCECEKRIGGHLRPELIIVEIIDENGKTAAPGVAGEVVVTPLGVTGMPLLRFKTGDISYLITEPCPCGRNSSRLGPVLGRKNQMLKFKGTTLYPNFILAAMEELEGVTGACIEAKKGPDGNDQITAYISLAANRDNCKFIEDHLRARLRVVPSLVVLPENELNSRVLRPEKRKRVTFVDMR